MKKIGSCRILIALMLALTLLFVSCGTGAWDHLKYDPDEIDFSEMAQAYMEYIDTNLPRRLWSNPYHMRAANFIRTELINAGYSEDQIILQEVRVEPGRSKSSIYRVGYNVILKVPGTGSDAQKAIVVGAHYDGPDTASDTQRSMVDGADCDASGLGDNGSGMALLLAEAVCLADRELPMTVYYVFFDCAEYGLCGSEAFVNQLSDEELDSIQYMINIDAIAFGDYCNIYSGAQDPETGDVSQTEIYSYACSLASDLGFNVYDTEYLDGYFAEHGSGPALDPNGIFTNPWTKANPAPEDTVPDSLHAYSPSTVSRSDQIAFMKAGIPYVYFESSNWYVQDPDRPDRSYTGYSDVGDISLGINGRIMNTYCDNLSYLNRHFPGRSMEHFHLYSPLLTMLITEPYIY